VRLVQTDVVVKVWVFCLDFFVHLGALGSIEWTSFKQSVYFEFQHDVVFGVQPLLEDQGDEIDDAVVELALIHVDGFEGEATAGLDGEAVFVHDEVLLYFGLEFRTLGLDFLDQHFVWPIGFRDGNRQVFQNATLLLELFVEVEHQVELLVQQFDEFGEVVFEVPVFFVVVQEERWTLSLLPEKQFLVLGRVTDVVLKHFLFFSLIV